MRRGWVLTAFLSLACGSPALSQDGGANPAGRFKEFDALFADVQRTASELVQFIEQAPAALKAAKSKPGPAGSPMRRNVAKNQEDYCRSVFALPSVGQSATPSKSPLPAVSREPARDYYLCLAMAQKDPRQCAGLDRVEFPKLPYAEPAPSSWCVESYGRLRLTQAIMTRDPKAAGICEEQFKGEWGAKTAEGCRIMTASSSASQACSQLARMMGDSKEMEAKERPTCISMNSLMRGDPVDCDSLKGKGSAREACLDLSKYRRVLAAKDESACGDSAVCQALAATGVKSCDRLLERVRSVSCKHIASVQFSAQIKTIEAEEKKVDAGPVNEVDKLMRTLRERRQAIEAMLLRSEQLLGAVEPKSDPGYMRREKEHRAVTRRVEDAFKRFKATTGQ